MWLNIYQRDQHNKNQLKKGNNCNQHSLFCSNLEFCLKTGSCFLIMTKQFKGLINNYIEILYTKFQVSMSFSPTYRLFEN